MDFETRPVEELPKISRGTRSAFVAAFAELPIGLAIFRSARADRPAVTASSTYGGRLRTHFPDRRIISRVDKEKHGCWFWWVEKEPSDA